jgi:hypothetical protein
MLEVYAAIESAFDGKHVDELVEIGSAAWD